MTRPLTLSAVARSAMVLAGVAAYAVITYMQPAARRQEFELLGVLGLVALIPLSLLLYRYSEMMLRARATARRQQQLFKAAAEGSLKAFALYKPVCNSKGEVVNFRNCYANGVAKRMLGLESQGKQRRSLQKVLRSRDAESVTAVFARVLTIGRPERLLVTLIGNGDPTIVMEAELEPMGSCVALCMTHRGLDEVTPEKIFELQEFTQSVIESAPISMIATDASGIIIAMNAAAEQLTLYSRGDLVGKHSLTLLHDPLELRARAEELASAGSRISPTGIEILTSKLRSCENSREWAYLRKDGTRAGISLVVTTLLTPGKRVTGYLCIGVDVTERKRLTDSVTHMARYDQLTGLANRSLLNERLAHDLKQARVLGRQLAVFMVDVDYFKRVNDSLGHVAGDEVLAHVARQLSASVQTRGTVARVGGDEFVVLLPNAGDRAEAEQWAQRMLTGVSAPVTIRSREVRMTASIGVSLYPGDGDTIDVLLRQADLAMYQAKSDGRACMRVYSAEMRQEAADRLEMEEDLRHALLKREFELHYQPQVSCVTGLVTGVEMLVRWNSAKRGDVPPNVFLPVAEQAGLMPEIGEWGLYQACIDCRQMQEALGRPIQVAVNLSPRQVNQRNLVEMVERALALSGLAARNLELEITEEILMESTARVKDSLKQLRALGCSVAIDDFGTGFCSFSYILEYKVDRLKIDRSFVARLNEDENANAIVRAIIAMGRGLNIELVAEGVETQEQLSFLLRKHCDSIQGWLFAKAMPVARLVSDIHEIEAHAQGCMGIGPEISMRVHEAAWREHRTAVTQ